MGDGAGRIGLVCGLSGGLMPTKQWAAERRPDRMFRTAGGHDASAVLISGGDVLAAMEEGRLNRIKHTDRLPDHAIRCCCALAGASPRDVALFARVGVESRTRERLMLETLLTPEINRWWTPKAYMADVLTEALGHLVRPSQIVLVEHHLTHAASTYACGPSDDALVVTLDGEGDNVSGTVSIGVGGTLERICQFSPEDSLGLFYLAIVGYLGYGEHDEYKVMGLAAYGDPSRFRPVFAGLCELEDEGRFRVVRSRIGPALDEMGAYRRPGQPITKLHMDVAAALQERLEAAVHHLVSHFAKATGLRHLCSAGGVAHNSAMNGKLARSGLFASVFVQPAADDAGCALGAALVAGEALGARPRRNALPDVYWGGHIGDGRALGERLATWSNVISARHTGEGLAEVASLIAGDAIVGWAQGRSEFGPRALGNRSILADPRPAAIKGRINAIVKERESYRPFAPVVQEEFLLDYFDVPPGVDTRFMGFTVPVRPEMREQLVAVTHVDGTARVQSVSQAGNERLWRLLEAFRQLTGVPVLLNTSFNHSVEPIVETLDDVLTCFLTTRLDYVVVGNYLVERRGSGFEFLLDLVPSLPEHATAIMRLNADADGTLVEQCCLHVAGRLIAEPVSPDVYAVLRRLDHASTLRQLLDAPDHAALAVLDEWQRLWSRRLVRFEPVGAGRATDTLPSARAEVQTQ